MALPASRPDAGILSAPAAEEGDAPRLGRALRRTAAMLVAFLLACAALLWFARDSDMMAAAAMLSPGVILACLALSLANYVLRGLRWVLLGRAFGATAPPVRQMLYFFAGFALTVTPGKLGEVVRLWLLRRHHGVPYARSMPLLAGDRVMDMVAICLLALAGAALTSHYLLVTAVLAAACVALLAALTHAPLLLHLIDWAERRLRRAPGLFAKAREVCATLPAIGRPGVLLPALGLSCLGWLAECLVLMLVVHALGTPIGLGEGMLVFCLAAVAGAVSLLPGGLGAADIGLLGLLRLVGVPEPAAIVATILVRLATLWFAVLLGLAALPFALRRR
ncbi:lysylphosphatidylglycerol synthase transmembrane domain-containing protein [Belnapia sp. F-4-1]|uniref:lysylphosphatidylglycerol synthase transmembrane domain-containing protein n=1 Tax=Belnapia sp. F-4-1 TaxID=1545443 RepID=UPI00068B8CE6|nr:lysylphosphatidylglycerol synthase transmembrane domain-containing protein [Belnapia sp. F-4-1]